MALSVNDLTMATIIVMSVIIHAGVILMLCYNDTEDIIQNNNISDSNISYHFKSNKNALFKSNINSSEYDVMRNKHIELGKMNNGKFIPNNNAKSILFGRYCQYVKQHHLESHFTTKLKYSLSLDYVNSDYKPTWVLVGDNLTLHLAKAKLLSDSNLKITKDSDIKATKNN